MVERVDYYSEEEFIRAQMLEVEQEKQRLEEEYYKTELAYMDYINEQIGDSKVFEILCAHTCNIMGGWYPYPARCIADCIGLSLYKVRKELKRLKELGVVISDHYCEVGEDGNYLINGWVVTQLGNKTDMYKKMDEEAAKAIRECFYKDVEELNQC